MPLFAKTAWYTDLDLTRPYPTREEAEEYERSLLIRHRVEEWAETHLCAYGMRREDVVREILGNLSDLVAALTPAP